MLNIDNYTLLWADEFETLSISNSSTRGSFNWYTQQPWGGGFSNATFLSDPLAGQFALATKGDSTSALEIKLRRDSAGALSSGLISNVFPDGTQASPHTTALGHYVETRLWLPNPYAGVWPAFWAIETERVLQTTTRDHVIELDVLEHYGAAMPDRWTTAIHDWDWNGTSLTSHNSVWQRCVSGPNVINTGWHTYGLDISENGDQTYYFDREPYFSVSGKASNNSTLTYREMLNTQLAWMINLAAGGGWPIDPLLGTDTLPASLWVDYFRVYKKSIIVAPPSQFVIPSFLVTITPQYM